MNAVMRRAFVVLCLVLAVISVTAPAMAAFTKYSDVPPGTPNGDQLPPGNPGLPEGGLTYYTDRTMFEADFPGLTLEDWSGTSVPPGNIVACPPPFDSSTNNACFTPGAIEPGISLDVILVAGGSGQLVVIGAGALGNAGPLVGPNTFAEHSLWSYSVAVGAFGTVFNCPIAPATMAVDIYDTSGGLLGSTTANCGAPPGNFWGVSSMVTIGRIEVTGGANDAELYGDTLFGAGPVPSMGSWGLLALLLVLAVGSALVLYRRRAA